MKLKNNLIVVSDIESCHITVNRLSMLHHSWKRSGARRLCVFMTWMEI